MTSLIVVDGSAISARGKGVSRYAVNLLHALTQSDPNYEYSILLDAEAILPPLPTQPNITYRYVSARPALWWHLFGLSLYLRNSKASVFHSLIELAPVKSPVPIVLTIHEVPHLRYQYNPSLNLYKHTSQWIHKKLFAPSLARATQLCAVSQNTRRDLIECYGISPAKVQVTLEGVDERFRPAHDDPTHKVEMHRWLNAEAGYVMCFATGDGRENSELVLKAWAQFKAATTGRALRLVMVGCGNKVTRQSLESLAHSLQIGESVRILGYVDDDTLIKLYQSTDLFIDYSSYEGFGLQCLEALACGAPVVYAGIPALVELMGGTGIKVPPADVQALATSFEQIISDEHLSSQLKRDGIERAKAFAWSDTAIATRAVYEQICSANRT